MGLENFKHNLLRLKKCDQYWDEMNPVPGGRRCSKCDKKIVDFSGMSFSEIAIYMAESKSPVCGFYLPQQVKQFKLPKSKLPIGITLLSLITTSTGLRAEKTHVQIEQHSAEHKPGVDLTIDSSSLHDEQEKNTVFIIGNVQYFDSTKKANMPLAYASINIKGRTNGVTTFQNGDFRIAYPQAAKSEIVTLLISSIGLETKEIEIASNGSTLIDLGTIILDNYQGELTEFLVTAKKRSKLNRLWRKITKPFR